MRKRITAVGLVLVLALTACSSGGDETDDTSGTTTATTVAP